MGRYRTGMIEILEIPKRALAIYAHPDDPEVSAGGTLARWAQAGSEVWVLVTTLGDKGSDDPATNPIVMAKQRRDETTEAMKVLGLAGSLHLDYPDGEVEDSIELRERIVRHVRELRPDVILCPDPTALFFGDRYINHRDHRITGLAALDAVAPASANPHYFPEHIAQGLAPHSVSQVLCSGTLAPNAWVDVATTIDRKIKAVGCHASQVGEETEWLPEVIRDRAAAAGAEVGVEFAEAFRRLQIS
ncbi:MAG: PIG-L family deacetylase [Actinobacteria bacterium]|nr:PIG-L family deacetylase [Actinomycetota bacterium]